MEESSVTVETKTYDPIKYEVNWGNVNSIDDLKDILSSLEIMFTIPAEIAPPKQKVLHDKGLLRVKE